MTTATTLPIVQELPELADPEQAFLRLADKPHCAFFDSSLYHPQLGRYSFVCADPYAVIDPSQCNTSAAPLLDSCIGQWKTHHSRSRPDLPPFQGGAAGVLGYELGMSFEQLAPPCYDEFRFPSLHLGLYDVVIAFDHDQKKSWLISQGFPETDFRRQWARATERRNQFLKWLNTPVPHPVGDPTSTRHPSAHATDICAPHHLVNPEKKIYSNFTDDSYRQAVHQAIAWIRAGDVFQVNLSQRLLRKATDSAVALYQRLRRQTPSTFGGYYDGGDWQIISASPERYLLARPTSEGIRVQTRPIKGTRKQYRHPQLDLFTAAELQSSPKDQAENVMIVDLMRNDLSRVCLPESVRVDQLCGLETYGYVQHLVSVVSGTLESNKTTMDLIASSFPGGSITGAPKIRAMQIITELEQVARGAYCGSLAFFDWRGGMDSSILIRTLTRSGGWTQFPVGGGIVVDSQASSELAETWHKAAGMVKAFAC